MRTGPIRKERCLALFKRFAVLTALDVLLCATASLTDTSGRSSSASFDFLAVNSRKTFLLPTRTERLIGKDQEHENMALDSRELRSNSKREFRQLPFGSSPGHGATASYNREHFRCKSRIPTVFRLFPKSGPIVGGTRITVLGAGFFSTGREICRFGSEQYQGKVDLVRASILTRTKMTCVTPMQNEAGSVLVSVSLDGYTFSSGALSALKGSGTRIFFNFTDHVPSGQFSIDNNTGPFTGGTLITVTLNANTAECGDKITHQAVFNFTKRVYLSDWNIAFFNDTLYDMADQQNASHRSGTGQVHSRVAYRGLVYDVIYPSSSAFTRPNGQSVDWHDVLSSQTLNTTFNLINNFAVAVQNASRNADGCLGPTRDATIRCMKLREPYILIVEERMLEYPINRRTCQSRVSYGRFEPSGRAKCMFSFPSTFLHEEIANRSMIASEVITVPAQWQGYNRLKCVSPRRYYKTATTDPGHPHVPQVDQPVSRSEAAVLRISNDGIHFSRPAARFTFKSSPPRIFNLYTQQQSGKHKARGPWTGNTEVYVNGSNFLPSENLKARFIIYNETEKLSDARANAKSILEQREGRCVFDTPEQIRCMSPRWYPGEHLLSRRGSLNPCFVVDVEVSNDGGIQWSFSADDNFLYCPIYVSTYGSNSWGEGTPRLPFRDISRAIQASLSQPRSFFLYKGLRPSGKLVGGRQQRGSERPMRGIVQYINLDQILLMDGMYRDRLGIFGPERNLNLIAHGRVIEVSSANFKNC